KRPCAASLSAASCSNNHRQITQQITQQKGEGKLRPYEPRSKVRAVSWFVGAKLAFALLLCDLLRYLTVVIRARSCR
ncbi:MAG TPA: hypothetical protein VFQ30_17480, partial [Ktedonobacteraceae bacterium]|nr:hypothetical protein [Ktedonobacteraceae bacterium]